LQMKFLLDSHYVRPFATFHPVELQLTTSGEKILPKQSPMADKADTLIPAKDVRCPAIQFNVE